MVDFGALSRTPQPVIARINAALDDALANASVRERLAARMKRAAQAANIRID